jgi:hypothetical protein
LDIKIKHTSIAGSITGNTVIVVLLSILLLLATTAAPFRNTLAASSNSNNNSGIDAIANTAADGGGRDNTNNKNKVVILAFADNPKSQFKNAKPILDQYGFKASFFVVCNWVGRSEDKMTWQDIATLQKEGHDIESHSMNHKDTDHLSAVDLDFEIGQSKQCLADHNINSTIFGSPHGEGWDNSTVTNTIKKYYELGRQGYRPVMFLHCDGYTKDSSQTDCATFFDNGTLTFANRYSIRSWSHNSVDQKFFFNDSEIYEAFVKEISEWPSKFNNNVHGTVNAIPIIGYHRIDNERQDTSTDIDEFAKEMKYLHDNGFTVLPMSSLNYNKDGNYFYLDYNSDNNKMPDNASSQSSNNNNSKGSSENMSDNNNDDDITIIIPTK